MAKKKKRGRRQGLMSKLMNALLIALGFSRVITHALTAPSPASASFRIIDEATFGLAHGSFDLNKGLAMYTPAAGAAALGYLKSFLMRKFPVR